MRRAQSTWRTVHSHHAFGHLPIQHYRFVLPIAIVAALGSGVRVMGYLARRFTLPFRLVSSYAVAAVCTVCFAFWVCGQTGVI